MSNAAEFSAKEQQVVDLLMQGKSNKQIAGALHISNRTVEFHLTNIYQKLGVASRAEAILQLTQNQPDPPHALRVSTVDLQAQNMDNRINHLSGGVLVKKRLIIAAGGLLLFAIIVYFVLLVLFRPVPGNVIQTQVAGVVAATIQSAPPTATDAPPATPALPTLQITTVPSDLTFSQTVGADTYKLTVNWFYIDSTRVEFDYTVCGLKLPDGVVPVGVGHSSETVIKKSTGEPIPLDDPSSYGAGDGLARDPAGSETFCFNQLDNFELATVDESISQSDLFTVDLVLGGDLGSVEGELMTLPQVDYSIQLRPTFQGQLTFTGQKSAQVGDKTVTLIGLQINPREIVADLCVDSQDGLQWMPETKLSYQGMLISATSGSLQDTESSEHMCYEIGYYGQFPISSSDEALRATDVILTRLVKDIPEVLPTQDAGLAIAELAEQGIAVNIVTGDHGGRIDIVKMPEGMTLADAQLRVQKAFTSDLSDGGPFVFNFE